MTEEKTSDVKLSTVGAFPLAPQAIPALVDPAKAESVIYLSQAPPLTLSGAKPVVDKPTTVVPSTLPAPK